MSPSTHAAIPEPLAEAMSFWYGNSFSSTEYSCISKFANRGFVHSNCDTISGKYRRSSCENNMNLGPEILVSGIDNPDKTEKFVHHMLDLLDVKEHILLSVRFYDYMPENLLGLTTAYSSLQGKKVVQVLIDSKIRPRKQEAVLSHELIHVKQFAKNELIIINSKEVLWKGKKFGNFNAHNKYVPWEQEAYKIALTLFNKTKKMDMSPALFAKTLYKCRTEGKY